MSQRRAIVQGGGAGTGDGSARWHFLVRPDPRGRALFLGDPKELGSGSRLRWFISTCVAATVGVVAIGAVLVGALEREDVREIIGRVDQRPLWERIWDLEKIRPGPQAQKREAGEGASRLQKEDRLVQAVGGTVMRHLIHDSLQQQRGARRMVVIRGYTRINGRLASAPPASAARIPAFNPFRLYANLEPIEEAGGGGAAGRAGGDGDVAVKVVELLGGFLPEEDGQELEPDEVAGLVAKSSGEALEPAEIRQAFGPEGAEAAKGGERPATVPTAEALPANTTQIARTMAEGEEDGEIEGREVVTERLGAGETLMAVLRKVGAEIWQAREIMDVANATYPVAQMKEGHEVRMTLVPSPTNVKRQIPIRVSVISEGQAKVTVVRSAAGAYVLAGSGVEAEMGNTGKDSEQQQLASLYTSLYHAASSQRIPPDIIELILRTNAYDVDFKRRVRPGDGFDLFFDARDPKDGEKADEAAIGDLLFTAITAGGETKRFYRFRTPDGAVEFYDEDGNNSKKFLMRKPVRGEEARLADGFGMRLHPLYRIRKMHTGLDWAAPSGTPILAAGHGIIEDAGRKGGYGNYIRIRHANGYKTTYAHMSRIAPGMALDARVRQGQIIGYVGSTGESTGPHLHFEILVNNSFVDPMRINVPREKKLTNRDLQDFKKERARIDELMQRQPVSSRVYGEAEPVAAAAGGRAAGLTTSGLRR